MRTGGAVLHGDRDATDFEERMIVLRVADADGFAAEIPISRNAVSKPMALFTLLGTTITASLLKMI